MTFPRKCEFEKARNCLDRLGLPYETVSPPPGYARVGVESLVMSQEARAVMFHEIGTEVVSAGWVDYRPAQGRVPGGAAAVFEQDIFGSCWIVVMAPCVADLSKIRLIAHISGDLTGVLPYLNAEMPGATYCRDAETLTYMEGYRLVSLYAQRLTVAKADELVDAWRTHRGHSVPGERDLAAARLHQPLLGDAPETARPGNIQAAAGDQLPGLWREDMHGVCAGAMERSG